MKTAYFGNDSDGISLTWNKKQGTVYISGWYDGMVGMEGECKDEADFFRALGMKATDLRRIAKKLEV